MTIGRFYAGIAALVWSPPTDKYLILKRSEEKDFGGGGWECVTGRVDQGEGFPEAVQREVYEELGVQARVEFILGTMHFYRGEPVPENELVGVVFCCSVDDPGAIKMSAEHTECRWVAAEEIDDVIRDEKWIRGLVKRAAAMRRLLPSDVLDFQREVGFDVG